MSLNEMLEGFVTRVDVPTVPYDPNKRIKRWVDKRAIDPANTSSWFSYKTYIRGDKGGVDIMPFSLTRKEASTANVPHADSPKNDQPEMEFPMRDLLPDESLIIGTMGELYITKKSAQAGSNSDAVLAKLDEIFNFLKEKLQ